MPAGKYSFIIEQGSTTNFELIYRDSENQPVDLTSYRARMQIKPSVDSDEVYLTLSSSLQSDGTGLNLSGSTGLNPPESGSIGIFISYLTSSELNFTQGYYDLEIASGVGENTIVTRVLEGVIQLSKNITTGTF